MDLLKRLGSQIEGTSPFRYGAFLLIAIAIHSGISPIGSIFVQWLRSSAESYPEAQSYLISSPLPLFLMRVMGYPKDEIWWAFGFAVYLSWMLLTSRYICREFSANKHLALLIFFLSTPASLSLSMLGHIDIYTLIGATLAVWGRFRLHILVGALFATGGNSDQSLASIACLVLLALAGSAKAKKVLPYWIVVSTISYGVLHLVIGVPDSHDTKQIIYNSLSLVVANSLSVWPFMVYSLFGILWLPVMAAIFQKYLKVKRLFALAGVVLLPMSMTFLIADGTRVGTTVGFICLLIVFDESNFRNPLADDFRLKVTGFLAVFLVLVPAILVDVSGELRIPLRKIFEAIGFL